MRVPEPDKSSQSKAILCFAKTYISFQNVTKGEDSTVVNGGLNELHPCDFPPSKMCDFPITSLPVNTPLSPFQWRFAG